MKVFASSMLCLFLAAPTALAVVPETLHYQGYLTTAGGDAVDCPDAAACPEQSFDVTFRLYADAEGGEALWEETHLAVAVLRGTFNVELGSVVPIDKDKLEDPSWLGLEVNAQGEMSPRQRLVSAAFAIRAGHTESALQAALADDADRLGGVDAADYALLSELPGLCVTHDDLAAESYLDAGDVAIYLTDHGFESGAHFTESDLGDYLLAQGFESGAHFTESDLGDYLLVQGFESGAHFTETDLGDYLLAQGFESGAHFTETDLGDYLLAQGFESGAHFTETDLGDYLLAQGFESGAHFSGTWLALDGVPEELKDGDDQRTNDEIIAIGQAHGFLTAADLPPAIPNGMVGFFAGSCPPGWTDMSASFGGRALVFAREGGSVGDGATVGTALEDLGTRTVSDVPSHSHVVDPPSSTTTTDGSHTHSGNTNYCCQAAKQNVGTSPTAWGPGGSMGSGGSHSHTVDMDAFSSDATGSASVDVTMPYLQLRACQAP